MAQAGIRRGHHPEVKKSETQERIHANSVGPRTDEEGKRREREEGEGGKSEKGVHCRVRWTDGPE